MNIFYVYAHYKPTSKVPFYIGKGKNYRAYEIFGRNKYWHNIVNKYGYRIEILHDHLDEVFALWLETMYIACHGRINVGEGTLVNVTDGGEGITGLIHTARSKFNISKHNAKYWAGKSRPELSKKFKGHSVSADTRQKLSDALKGRPLSTKTKLKMKGRIPWNKGKTGMQVSWNKGLTAQTDPRVALNALHKRKEEK